MKGQRSKNVLLFLSVLATCLLLASCGGGGGGSAPYIPPTGPGTGGVGGGQGSSTNPVSLGTVGPPANYAGSIGAAGQSYYKFRTDSNGGTFKISLSNTHSGLQWLLYDNANFSGFWLTECDNLFSSGDVTCLTNPDLSPNTDYYLEVLEYGLTADTYSLSVAEVVSEGTPTGPILLTVGATHAGSVNASGTSYYKFQTNSAGQYSIAISNPMSNGGDWLGITISSTDFSSPTIVKTCTASTAPVCSVNGLAASTYYYVAVSQSYASDVIYDIIVNPGSSEGSVSGPIQLTYGSDHAGAVDAYGYSYYTFTPTNTGSSVISAPTISGASSIYVSVYSGSDFTTGLLSNCLFAAGQSCAISGVNSGQPYYLLVKNGSGSTGYSYTLNVHAGGTEGSLSQPVTLPTGSTHTASLEGSSTAYYTFNTGADGPSSGSGTYSFGLTTSLSAQVQLYSDPGFSQAVTLSWNLDSNKDYYLKVVNNSASAGTFSITITTGAGHSEGSVNTPVALTESTPFSGRIGSSEHSYYTFTPSANTAYLIRLTNVLTGTPGDVMWYLYASANFSSSLVDYSSGGTYAGDTVYVTSSALSAGTPYYLEVYNWPSTANTYTITITPFDVSLGCNSGGTTTCFNFDAGVPTTNSFVNGPTDIYASASAWTLFASATGGGTQSFESTAPNGKPSTYNSCFRFSATDVKWIAVSSRISSAPTAGTDYIDVYVDGVMDATIAYGNSAWKRIVYSPPSGGSHTFEWCFDKSSNASGSYGDVDDIELNY